MTQPDHDEIVYALGNSMDLAGIEDGDPLYLRYATEAIHGAIVVVRVPGEGVTVKRYCEDGAVGWLVPESSDRQWRPRHLAEGDTLLGVVVGTGRGLVFFVPRAEPHQPPPLREVPPHKVKLPPPDPPAWTLKPRYVPARVKDGAPPPPPWPEDVLPCYGQGAVSRRLSAIQADPAASYAMIEARQAWEREWVDPAGTIAGSP